MCAETTSQQKQYYLNSAAQTKFVASLHSTLCSTQRRTNLIYVFVYDNIALQKKSKYLRNILLTQMYSSCFSVKLTLIVV